MAVAEPLHLDARAVLVLESVFEHLELQFADRAEDRILFAAGFEEELHRALLGELLDALLHLFSLHGIEQANPREVLGREAWHDLEAEAGCARERVPDPKYARIV